MISFGRIKIFHCEKTHSYNTSQGHQLFRFTNLPPGCILQGDWHGPVSRGLPRAPALWTDKAPAGSGFPEMLTHSGYL